VLDASVVTVVRKYLQLLQQHGIAVRCGVVFGSQVTGKTHAWSDIDLLVVSPCFDTAYDYRIVDLLWRLSARVDSRIEPIPCGERQWEEDDASTVVEIARRDGEQVSVDEVSAPTKIPTTRP
jgi:predicted nucleotidyltransferase